MFQVQVLGRRFRILPKDRLEKKDQSQKCYSPLNRSNPLTKSGSDDAATLATHQKLEIEESSSSTLPYKSIDETVGGEATSVSSNPSSSLQCSASASPMAALNGGSVSSSDLCIGVAKDKTNTFLIKKKKRNPSDMKDSATQTLPRLI